jgi:hypothetical protein
MHGSRNLVLFLEMAMLVLPSFFSRIIHLKSKKPTLKEIIKVW